MASRSQWKDVIAARLARPRLSTDELVLLDTAMGSENSGDFVIMDACEHISKEIFSNRCDLVHLATHYYSEELESHPDALKLLCGTNILYTHMADQGQWALPRDLRAFSHVCLFGVGMSDIGIGDSIDAYTRQFYKAVLDTGFMHSVRDEMTRQRLLEIGITNVLNTACPTMWSLTPEAQKRIPCIKARNVLTSITDYAFSPDDETAMLNILKEEYEHVAIWVQGSHDLDWCLEKIVNLDEYELVGPEIGGLDAILERSDLDYVGTRLHAGIRSLNRGHRSLIVAVDNRARQIGHDTGLPVIERSAFYDGQLRQWINNPEPSAIELPWDAIDQWKNQFNDLYGTC